jgi:PilZ domain
VSISEHVFEKDFERYLARLIPNGKDSVIEAHLGECTACVVKLSAADGVLYKRASLSATPSKEQRREPRFLCDDPAVLQVVSPFSAEPLEGRLVDVSKNGLRFHVVTDVMPGSLVKVKMKTYIAFGESRYCLPAAEGFYVGIQIHDYVARESIRAVVRNRSELAAPTAADHTSPPDGGVKS